MAHETGTVRYVEKFILQLIYLFICSQAGRYIGDFRKFSDKYGFRERSETPEIAVELSLQPWHKFGVDGVIIFSGVNFQLELFFAFVYCC